ncbi:hypothetical protein [Streptomyces sp. NBC_01803]|uniref:hypothetical protein n=1 Tax=Streptomyces sp. NBC_01803 TaxID=2975946 RepID=UPI002DDACF64|nr:hypothetical protein [Streptomyces sp. NBC_01803]WSA43736.1 hypothetical protein OIE51_05685 [Streptomyces sp. NBC_01803]
MGDVLVPAVVVVVALAAVVFAVASAAALFGSALAKGRAFWRDEPRTWSHVAGMLLVAALAVYCWGAACTWDGAESEYHACSLERYGSPDHPPGRDADYPRLLRREVSLVPGGMSARCEWSDGPGREEVPGFVNPGVSLFLAGAAGCAVTGLVRCGRAARQSSSS